MLPGFNQLSIDMPPTPPIRKHHTQPVVSYKTKMKRLDNRTADWFGMLIPLGGRIALKIDAYGIFVSDGAHQEPQRSRAPDARRAPSANAYVVAFVNEGFRGSPLTRGGFKIVPLSRRRAARPSRRIARHGGDSVSG